jgi:hypothetical protein
MDAAFLFASKVAQKLKQLSAKTAIWLKHTLMEISVAAQKSDASLNLAWRKKNCLLNNVMKENGVTTIVDASCRSMITPLTVINVTSRQQLTNAWILFCPQAALRMIWPKGPVDASRPTASGSKKNVKRPLEANNVLLSTTFRKESHLACLRERSVFLVPANCLMMNPVIQNVTQLGQQLMPMGVP